MVHLVSSTASAKVTNATSMRKFASHENRTQLGQSWAWFSLCFAAYAVVLQSSTLSSVCEERSKEVIVGYKMVHKTTLVVTAREAKLCKLDQCRMGAASRVTAWWSEAARVCKPTTDNILQTSFRWCAMQRSWGIKWDKHPIKVNNSRCHMELSLSLAYQLLSTIRALCMVSQ